MLLLLVGIVADEDDDELVVGFEEGGTSLVSRSLDAK